MGLMDRGARALVRRKKQADGRTVTYTRLAGGSLTLTAWLGETLYSQTTEEPGASVVWGDRDYLCEVADLKLNGTPFEPAEGDRVAETMPDGTVAEFDIKTPTGEPPYRYSDQTRLVWRLHCMRAN